MMVPRAVWSLDYLIVHANGWSSPGAVQGLEVFSVVVGGRVLLNTLRPHEMVPTAECQGATDT